MGYTAVLWDFGGVITTSPFEAFNRFVNVGIGATLPIPMF